MDGNLTHNILVHSITYGEWLCPRSIISAYYIQETCDGGFCISAELEFTNKRIVPPFTLSRTI